VPTPTTPANAPLCPGGPNGQKRSFGRFFLSSGEPVTALGPTGLEHGSTSSGAHPVTKAMLFGAATIVGLKCALHRVSLLRLPPGFGHHEHRRMALRWDYNMQHSSGRCSFFSPVDNLLRSRSLRSRAQAVHTLWIVLWTRRGALSAGQKGSSCWRRSSGGKRSNRRTSGDESRQFR
jgi:hypothetical protein